MVNATDFSPSTGDEELHAMREPAPSPFTFSRADRGRFQDETLLLHTAPIFSPGPVSLGADEDWGDSFALDSPEPRGVDSADELGDVFERDEYTGRGERVVHGIMNATRSGRIERTPSEPLGIATAVAVSPLPSAHAQNKMTIIHPPTPTQPQPHTAVRPVNTPKDQSTALARYLAKQSTGRLDVFGPAPSQQVDRVVPGTENAKLAIESKLNTVQVTATPSMPDPLPPQSTDDGPFTGPTSPATNPSPTPSLQNTSRFEASTPVKQTRPAASSPSPQPVYPLLPTPSMTRGAATETPRRTHRKRSLTASVQSFFAGFLHKTPVQDSLTIIEPSPGTFDVPLSDPQLDTQAPVNAHAPASSKNAIDPNIVQRAAPSTARTVGKRKRRDNDTGPPKVTRIRLFGPEDKSPRAIKPVKVAQKTPGETNPASRPERALITRRRPLESPKRPWREAARARGPTQQQTHTVEPPAVPISRTHPPSAPLQLTRPKPFAFAQPRVPTERVQDVVKPHERAKDIAARKAVFERQAYRPSVTVPEVGRTPGRLIRQRVEERRLFESGLRQRDEERRKAKEEADRERLRLEAAEDAQRRKETIIWAHPVPDMYRRPRPRQIE